MADHLTSVMMTYIILFSPDFVQLENKKIVEKIQVYNIHCGTLYNVICISVQLLETPGETYLLFGSSANWKKQVLRTKHSFIQFIQSLYYQVRQHSQRDNLRERDGRHKEGQINHSKCLLQLCHTGGGSLKSEEESPPSE